MEEKIGVFSVTPLWEQHNSQLVEIIWREYSQGASPIVYHCSSALESCRTNPYRSINICKTCIWQTNRNIKSLIPRSATHVWIEEKSLDKFEKMELEKINSHHEMLSFTHDNFPIGRAVISQLQTIYRETIISDSIIKTHGVEVLKNVLGLYKYFKLKLIEDKVEKAYVFGGRYASERAFIFAAQTNEIPFNTFDSGSRKNKIWISEIGETSFKSYWIDIENKFTKTTHELDRGKILEKGSDFFQSWKSGTSNHANFLNPNVSATEHFSKQHLKLPLLARLIETKKAIISIFTSTNYENASFDDFKVLEDEIVDQFSIIERISNSPNILEYFDIFVRWHPNSLTSGPGDLSKIQNCISNSFNLIHIAPDQIFDSYQLIEKSDVVVSFGSTIGIEAAAQGKASILLGKSSYSNLDAVYEPRTYKELLSLLKREVKPKPRENALRWGWWRDTFGEEMTFVKVKSGNFFLGKTRVKSRKLRLLASLNLFKHKCKTLIFISIDMRSQLRKLRN